MKTISTFILISFVLKISSIYANNDHNSHKPKRSLPATNTHGLKEGAPSSSARLVDINANKLVFERPDIELTVLEDSKVGTSLATFLVTDVDQGGNSRITYQIDKSIWYSDKHDQFKIDQDGVVKIKRMLDREQTVCHIIKIIAFDDGVPQKTGTATLSVTVGDINDNPPRLIRDYRPIIREHSPPGKVVELYAFDSDDWSKRNGPPFTFKIDPDAPELIRNSFEIQQNSSVENGDRMAVLLSKVEFDREKQNEYLVPIIIKDSGYPSTTGTSTLTVIISDVNDTKLVFERPNQEVTVIEDSKPGTSLALFLSTNVDQGRITYQIDKSSDKYGQFKIGQDGVVKIKRMLDWEQTARHQIKILAVEDCVPQKTGTATLTVDVRDINDNAPRFSQYYPTIIREHSPPGKIAEILVSDNDDWSKDNGPPFTFRIDPNAPELIRESFEVQHNTSVKKGDRMTVLSKVKFDRKTQNEYLVPIIIKDSGYPSMTGTSTLTVIISEDNKLVFEEPNIEVTVLEDSRVGTNLATFLVRDFDQGGNSRITYQIDKSSDKYGQFNIGQDGVVKIKRMLDREQNAIHKIRILAVDDGVPQKTGTATLTVIVGDINDNSPRLIRDYRPTIREHSPPGIVLDEIIATDEDEWFKGNGPPFTFEMDPDAPELIRNSFVVQHNSKGGDGNGMAVLLSKVQFDREKQKEYSVPIIIKDSGYPSMTGTSTLTVIIGDLNDN